MVTTKYLDKCCNRQYTIGMILANWAGVTERNVIKHLLSFIDHTFWNTSDIEQWADFNHMDVDDLAKYLRKVKKCIGVFSYDKPTVIDDCLEETTCYLNIGNGVVLNFKYMLNRP